MCGTEKQMIGPLAGIKLGFFDPDSLLTAGSSSYWNPPKPIQRHTTAPHEIHIIRGLHVVCMPRLRWSQSVSDDAEVAVVRCETEDQGETLGRTSYDIRATFTDSISDEARFISPGDAVVENVEWLSADSPTDLMATVTVLEATTVERVVGYWDTTRTPLYLPSKSFLKAAEAASNGNRDAVRTVLDAFDTPVQIPVICGAFLDHQSVIDLVETVTSVDRHAASVIHSYRYPILRGALVSPIGLDVESAAELELLADGFDSMEAIGNVDYLDCLADVMATAHGSIEETDRLLESLGYELSELETEADGQFFAYYLAHVVLCDGFTTAVEHTRQRRRHLNEDYEQLKQEARNAPYRRRGETWRRLLSPAARMTMGEFAYVLANALYWTGEVSRSDSRVSELLCEAAAAVARVIDLADLEASAEYELNLAAGHRLRAAHQYEPAAKRFEQSAELATTNEPLPEWKPSYNKRIVRAHHLQGAGKHERARNVLGAGIKDLLQQDVHPESANRAIHHLKGRQLEVEAASRRNSDLSEVPYLLADASEHYEAIGFDRSRDRAERKLATATQRSQSQTETEATEQPKQPHPDDSGGVSTGEQSQSAPEPSESVSAAEPSSPSEPEREVVDESPPQETPSFSEPPAYPELDDGLAPYDKDKAGSGDIMTGPDTATENPEYPEGYDQEPGWY